MSKVTLTIDEEVLAEARKFAGPRQLSAYVTDALAWRIEREHQRIRVREMLDEMDAEYGPVPEEMLEEARKLWQPVTDADAPKHRRSA